MKRFFPLLILFLVFLGQIQAQDEVRNRYERRVAKATRMRNAGIGMTAGGLILGGLGINLISEANKTKEYSDEQFLNSAGGVACIVAGLIVSVTGGVLWTVGGSQRQHFKGKLRDMSVQLTPAPDKVLSLVYHL